MGLLAEKVPVDVHPRAKALFARAIGKWVGHKLSVNTRQQDISQLRVALNKAIALCPEEPSNYYRLGTIACVEKKRDEAVSFFGNASSCERSKMLAYGEDPYLARAEITGSALTELNLARFAAYGVRITSRGDLADISTLKDYMSEARDKHRISVANAYPLAFEIVDHFADARNEPNFSVGT